MTTARQTAALLGGYASACLLAALLVGSDLELPGVYDDEVVQAEEAVQFIDGKGEPRGIPGSRAVQFMGRRFPSMTQPYMGALKSQLLIPIFATFGATPTVLRATTLTWSLLGLLFAMLWARNILGLRAALLAGFLVAADPSFLWVSRHDFGSFALGFLCRCGSLYLLHSGWTLRSSFRLVSGGLLLGLGLYNKIDFAIFVAAAAMSLLCLTPGVFAQALRRWRRSGAAILGFALGVAPLLVALGDVMAVTQHFLSIRDRGPVLWKDKLAALMATLDGSHFHTQMLAGGRHMDGFADAAAASVFPALFGASVVLLFVLLGSDRRGEERQSGPAFVLAMAGFSVLGILLLPRAIRTHHMLNLYPFPHLVVACAAAQLWERRGWARAAPLLARFAAVVVIAASLAGSLYVNARCMETVKEAGGRGLWSNARTLFAAELEDERPPPVVVAFDWGFYWSMSFVAHDLDIVDPTREIKLRQQHGKTWTSSGSPRHVYLVFEREYRSFSYGIRLLDAARRLRPDLVQLREHRDTEGRMVFHSIRITRPHKLHLGRKMVIEVDES
jgi:hypothetical protein